MGNDKWVEVNLDNIAHNLCEIKKLVLPKTKILAVVKGNAYGHGIVEIARFLSRQKIDMLGVSTLEEATQLRDHAIGLPILIMAPITPKDAFNVIKYDLTPSVFTKEVIEALAAATPRSQKTKIHLKIDTGMGRYGILPEEVVLIAKFIKKYPNLDLEGVFSHFSNAQNNDLALCQQQFDRFQQSIRILAKENLHPTIKHICNSAGLLVSSEFQLDMIRVGNLLYGIYPIKGKKKLSVKKAWTLKAKISHIKKVTKDIYLGYGKAYKTSGQVKIAYIPIGRIDGFNNALSIQATNYKELLIQISKIALKILMSIKSNYCLIRGNRCNIVGKVGMQFAMIDVTNVHEINVGEIVELSASCLAVKENVPIKYLNSDFLTFPMEVV